MAENRRMAPENLSGLINTLMRQHQLTVPKPRGYRTKVEPVSVCGEGTFHCKRCSKRSWGSTYAWISIDLVHQMIVKRWKMRCVICKRKLEPYFTLDEMKEMVTDAIKIFKGEYVPIRRFRPGIRKELPAPHLASLCEMCDWGKGKCWQQRLASRLFPILNPTSAQAEEEAILTEAEADEPNCKEIELPYDIQTPSTEESLALLVSASCDTVSDSSDEDSELVSSIDGETAPSSVEGPRFTLLQETPSTSGYASSLDDACDIETESESESYGVDESLIQGTTDDETLFSSDEESVSDDMNRRSSTPLLQEETEADGRGLSSENSSSEPETSGGERYDGTLIRFLKFIFGFLAERRPTSKSQ